MAIPTLYLFEASSGIYGVAIDKTGRGLPPASGRQGWRLQRVVKPDELPADTVLTAFNKGFCLLEPDDFQPPPKAS